MSERKRRGLPKYAPAVIAEAAKVPRGQVAIIDILHDGWCALLKGSGACNCSPDVMPAKIVAGSSEGPRGTGT